MHRYFQISSYTSDKHYQMTHDVGENYNKILDMKQLQHLIK